MKTELGVVLAVVAVLMSVFVWTLVHNPAKFGFQPAQPVPAVAEADPLLRQLTEDNEALRSENATLREQLRACQSEPNVLPSARGDDPEDDPGR